MGLSGAMGGGRKLDPSDGLIPRFMEDLFESLFRRREASEKALDAELDELLEGLPNLPADGIPDGDGEDDNTPAKRNRTTEEEA